MIFDDDSDILEICSIILQQKGYEVKTENTCKDILQKVTAYAPDIIMMDNKIPDEGGIASTKKLKANPATSFIPVIFFSANTNVIALSKEATAEYYLQKPFDIEDLEMLVKEIISKDFTQAIV